MIRKITVFGAICMMSFVGVGGKVFSIGTKIVMCDISKFTRPSPKGL